MELTRERAPEPASGLEKLFSVALAPVKDAPFAHAVTDGFFKADVFEELKRTFPQVEARNASKQWARGLYWGDDEYERHLDKNPVWRSLFEAVHSQAFVDHIGRQFADTWQSPNCLVDFAKARFIPYREDRKEKESGSLSRPEHGVNDIWSRLDIYHGWPGYTRAAHLDHRRRLLSMLVYFDSPEDIGMVGGELALHAAGLDLSLMSRLGAYRCPPSWLDMRRHWSEPVVITPKKNRAAAFPCTPSSWHSVPTIQALREPRAFLHIVLSSSREVWRSS